MIGADADSGQSDDAAIGKYLESLGLNVQIVGDKDDVDAVSTRGLI